MPDVRGQCQAVGADHGSCPEVPSETMPGSRFSADNMRIEQWMATIAWIIYYSINGVVICDADENMHGPIWIGCGSWNHFSPQKTRVRLNEFSAPLVSYNLT